MLGVYQIEHLRSGKAKKSMTSINVKHVIYGHQNKFNLATVRLQMMFTNGDMAQRERESVILVL